MPGNSLLEDLEDDDEGVGSSLLADIGGPSPEEFMADADAKEAKFQNWYSGVSKKIGISSDPDEKEHYYDYRGFHDALERGEVQSPDQPGGHWDSKFKSDDHPRRYLKDPETGRLFDTHTGKYVGGAREEVPGDRMNRINEMDTPDLSKEEWAAAAGGADKPQGEDDLEQSILGAILDTAGDFAGTMFSGRAQQYDLPESGPNPGELLLGGGLKGGAGILTKLGKGLGGKVAASLGNAGIEAGIAGAHGAAEGFDESDEATILERVLDAGKAAAGAAGLAGGVTFGLDALGGTAGKLGDAAKWLARKADNTKAGSTHRIREDLIEKFGIEDGPDKLGELLRKYSPSGLFSPKTSADHLAAIESQLGDEGVNLAQMTRQAGSEGADAAAPGAMLGAQQDMLTKAADLDSAAYADSAEAEARKLEQLLYRSQSKPLPTSFEGLIGAKAQYGEDAFRPVTGFADEDASSQAAKQAWMSMKDAEGQALQSVTPDTAERFGASQQAFGELSGLNESLRPRAAADDAVGNIGTAAVGAAAGAMMPGGQGIMGALTSGTNNAVRQMTGGVAHDMFANVMHPLGSAGQATGAGLQGIARPAGLAAAGGYLASEDESRGHQTSDLVRSALQSNPQLLGEYAQKLQEAEETGELSTTVGALIEDDPRFPALLKRLKQGRR